MESSTAIIKQVVKSLYEKKETIIAARKSLMAQADKLAREHAELKQEQENIEEAIQRMESVFTDTLYGKEE